MAGQRIGAMARRKLAGIARLLADPPYRGAKLQAWFGRKGLFQPFNVTREDRYPQIFDYLVHELGGRPDLRILSFGCSTGEEVFSLARLFPLASIRGVDINPANIARARARLAAAPDPRLSFAVARSTDDEPPAHYDAILCMAVFRDGRLGHAPASCERYLRFAMFAAAISGLVRTLKPEGLLALRHSNFRFSDTAASQGFKTVLSLPYRGSQATPIYGPDDRLRPGLTDSDCVFRKPPTGTGG